MKFIRFSYNQQQHYGVLNHQVIQVIAGDLFGQWEKTAQTVQLEDVQLLAPVKPPNIIAVGLNYRSHAVESGFAIPDAPVLFLKATTSITALEAPIILPTIAADAVDFEAELAVVIGKTAKNIPRESALEYVFGYTCANDVSARDCQLKIDKQWARGKSFDTFCPLGPVIETELDPANCRVISRLNGAVMQDSTTQNLIFDIPELVHYCSRNMTLLPGTVILTGTPEGAGFARKPPVYLQAGDRIEVEVSGIGILANPVKLEED